MKNLLLLALVFIGINQAEAQANMKTKKPSTKTGTVLTNYEVDNNATTILWTGKKVGGKHNGKIKVSKGVLVTSGTLLNRGSIVIDMNSMTCDDITDAEYNEKLMVHLKNEDFFNTTSFPEAKLELTKVTYKGSNTATIAGNLTIKNKTNPINFNMKIANVGNKMTAVGKLIFDRTKFDVKYGSTLFGAAADKAIENRVSLEINLVANKK